jgi:tetratricopeptide (TPR) repeat protein
VANGNTETERDRAVQNYDVARGQILNLAHYINQMVATKEDPKAVDLAQKQALDEAREQFEKFRKDQPDDITLMRQAARMHRYSAHLSRSLNDYNAAQPAYIASIRILEDLTARFPDNHDCREDLAVTLIDQAGIERLTGRLNEAGAALDRALKFSASTQGKIPDSSYRRTRGTILLDKSVLADTLGRFDDALRFAEMAAEQLRRDTTSANWALQPYEPLREAMAINRVALAQRELGNTTKALAAHDDAVARMKPLAGPKANRDERYWDCEFRRERARTAVEVPDRRKAALADLAQMIPIAEKLVEENPHIYFYKAGLASTYLYRGELLLALDKPDEATAELTKSLAVSRVLLDRHGVLTKSMLVRGNTFLALGRARAAAGKPAEAQGHWKNAAKVFEIALKIDKDNFHHRRGLAEAQKLLNPPSK